MLVLMVPVAPVGGQRMSVPPLAHAGHWLAQIAYLAPLVLLVAMLVAGKLRSRRERRRNAGVTDA
jgi:cytochrome b561